MLVEEWVEAAVREGKKQRPGSQSSTFAAAKRIGGFHSRAVQAFQQRIDRAVPGCILGMRLTQPQPSILLPMAPDREARIPFLAE